MLEFFWNYFKGYVIIEVKGKTLERFLNMAAYKEIKLWDIKESGASTIVTVSIKDFKKLKYISRKTNCKYRIIKKYGAPFFLHRYRKRKVLMFGIPFFLLFLYVLTSFIWSVDIIGVNRVSYSDLRLSLETLGIREGTFKPLIEKETIEDYLLDSFPDISFINLDIRGTRAILTISENIPDAPIIDRTHPIDLIANRDALIELIYISSGTPQVSSGDVVARGDLLVSGTIHNEVDLTTYYVHSSADIRAYVYYTLDFFVENNTSRYHPTGQIKSKISLNLFGRTFSIPTLFPHGFENYETFTSRTSLNFGEYYPLPFVFILNQTNELEKIEYARSPEEITQTIHKIITESILTYFDFDIDISKIDIYTTYQDDGVQVHVVITTLENIATEVPSEIITENY